MSTRSAIIVKVKPSDIGKIMKFDKSKLPCKLEKWDVYGDEIGAEKSEEVKISKPYLGIYCHSDGYINGVGMALKEKFTDYDAILNLIIGGCCSVVWFDRIRHYANREGAKWSCLKPIQGKTASSVANHIGHNGYVYLFDNGGWRVNKGRKFLDYNEKGVIE